MTAPVAAGSRLEWEEVPPHVRRGIEDVLGARVAAARTQTGGFSPGVAARVDLADGRRVFVKAVGSAVNPETPDLNRAEIVALHLMPAHLPVARLLGSYDGDWVALVLEDVEGRRPPLPWTCADVTSVTATLRAVAGTTAPEELPAFAGPHPARRHCGSARLGVGLPGRAVAGHPAARARLRHPGRA